MTSRSIPAGSGPIVSTRAGSFFGIEFHGGERIVKGVFDRFTSHSVLEGGWMNMHNSLI